MVHEPAQGTFDDPPALDDAEPLDVGVFGDDFDVDAQGCAVFDHCGLEAGVVRRQDSTPNRGLRAVTGRSPRQGGEGVPGVWWRCR